MRAGDDVRKLLLAFERASSYKLRDSGPWVTLFSATPENGVNRVQGIGKGAYRSDVDTGGAIYEVRALPEAMINRGFTQVCDESDRQA